MRSRRHTTAVSASSSPSAAPRWLGVAVLLLGVGSLAHFLAYLRVAIARIRYPYELEWIEGGILDHVLRVLHGQPLYAEPSLRFIALNYPPLYYWVAAPFVATMSDGLFPLRLVSLLSSVVVFVLAFTLVRFETGRASLGLLAVGLFAGAYRLGGAWLDIARSDSLYLALLMGGVTALRLDRAALRSGIFAGVLFALAFLAKQSALAVAAPVAVWLLIADRPRGIPLVVTFAAGVGGSIAALQATSSGWFWFYVFRVAGAHPALLGTAATVAWNELIRPLWPGLLAIAATALPPAVPRPGKRARFYVACAIGFVGSSWSLRLYPGTYENVMLTAYLAFAIGAPLALGWLLERAPRATLPAASATLLLGVQVVLLTWPMGAQLPLARDAEQGDALVRQIRSVPGPVYVPLHGYLARRAGKSPGAHFMAMLDVLNSGQGPRQSAVWTELNDSLAAHAWTVLILDQQNWLMDAAVHHGYRPVASAFPDSTSFYPVTGNRTRPEIVLAAP